MVNFNFKIFKKGGSFLELHAITLRSQETNPPKNAVFNDSHCTSPIRPQVKISGSSQYRYFIIPEHPETTTQDKDVKMIPSDHPSHLLLPSHKLKPPLKEGYVQIVLEYHHFSIYLVPRISTSALNGISYFNR